MQKKAAYQNLLHLTHTQSDHFNYQRKAQARSTTEMQGFKGAAGPTSPPSTGKEGKRDSKSHQLS